MSRIKPPEQRRGRGKPVRGEFRAAAGTGWQHGPIPAPPPGLLKISRVAWETWMHAWFAAHWQPADLPGLRVVVRLYDRVQRGDYARTAESRIWQDGYGITPKGADERRWRRPAPEPAPPIVTLSADAHLHSTDGPPRGRPRPGEASRPMAPTSRHTPTKELS